VYFERSSDGARSQCSPGWAYRIAASRFDAALRSCITDHLGKGFARVPGPPASARPPSSPVWTAVALPGRPGARIQPAASASNPADPQVLAADRERRMQAALLAAQLQSRARYLDERLTPRQHGELTPLLRSLIQRAAAGAPDAQLSPLAQQITRRARKLALAQDTRSELAGLLRDGARLAELGGFSQPVTGSPDEPSPTRSPTSKSQPKSKN
jgi:hypothetical protein